MDVGGREGVVIAERLGLRRLLWGSGKKDIDNGR